MEKEKSEMDKIFELVDDLKKKDLDQYKQKILQNKLASSPEKVAVSPEPEKGCVVGKEAGQGELQHQDEMQRTARQCRDPARLLLPTQRLQLPGRLESQTGVVTSSVPALLVPTTACRVTAAKGLQPAAAPSCPPTHHLLPDGDKIEFIDSDPKPSLAQTTLKTTPALPSVQHPAPPPGLASAAEAAREPLCLTRLAGRSAPTLQVRTGVEPRARLEKIARLDSVDWSGSGPAASSPAWETRNKRAQQVGGAGLGGWSSTAALLFQTHQARQAFLCTGPGSLSPPELPAPTLVPPAPATQPALPTPRAFPVDRSLSSDVLTGLAPADKKLSAVGLLGRLRRAAEPQQPGTRLSLAMTEAGQDGQAGEAAERPQQGPVSAGKQGSQSCPSSPNLR